MRSAWLEIAQLVNADDLLRFQMGLEESLKKKIAKWMAEEVRARNAQGAHPAESLDDFALRVGRVLNSMLHGGLLGEHVGLGGADGLQLLQAWRSRAAPVLAIDGNADMTEQATGVAEKLTLDLLEFLCTEHLGTTVDKVLKKAQQERARAVVSTEIKLEHPTVVRANVVRFLKMHVELHGAPSAQLAVADLYSRLDDGIKRLMPGRTEACALLEAAAGANAAAQLAKYQDGAKMLAIKADDVADKLYMPPKPKEKKPVGPTVPREDKHKHKNKPGEARERSTGTGESIKCWECGEQGLYKGHKGCTRALKLQKQPCFVCGETGHMQRECPTQVCHGCKKLGHCLRDCPAGAANKQQDSTCLVLAVEAVAESVPEVVAAAGVAVSTAQEVPKVGAVAAVSTVTAPAKDAASPLVVAGGVLVVSGDVNGKDTAIGIDSFAGIGMATVAATAGAHLYKTSVRLQGVAHEAVVPYGEADLLVKVGMGPGFVERVAVVDELPGGVGVLVGWDTIEQLGLHVTKGEVVLGGEKCTRIRSDSASAAGAVGREEAAAESARREDKAQEKRLRAELRAKDPLFRKLESQGQIEEVFRICEKDDEDDPTAGMGYRAVLGAMEPAVRLADLGSPTKVDASQKRRGPNAAARKSEEAKVKRDKKDAKRSRRQNEWAREVDQLAKWEQERAALESQEMKEEEVRREWERRAHLVAVAATGSWSQVPSRCVEAVVGVAAGPKSVTPVAMTVKAAHAIEMGHKTGVWDKVRAEEFLGTELEAESVDPDEFCMPEPRKTWDAAAQAEFQERVDALAAKSALREPGSRERYKKILLRHRGAYTLSVDHFKPG